jgi:hypothetical protein
MERAHTSFNWLLSCSCLYTNIFLHQSFLFKVRLKSWRNSRQVQRSFRKETNSFTNFLNSEVLLYSVVSLKNTSWIRGCLKFGKFSLLAMLYFFEMIKPFKNLLWELFVQTDFIVYVLYQRLYIRTIILEQNFTFFSDAKIYWKLRNQQPYTDFF